MDMYLLKGESFKYVFTLNIQNLLKYLKNEVFSCIANQFQFEL